MLLLLLLVLMGRSEGPSLQHRKGEVGDKDDGDDTEEDERHRLERHGLDKAVEDAGKGLGRDAGAIDAARVAAHADLPL